MTAQCCRCKERRALVARGAIRVSSDPVAISSPIIWQEKIKTNVSIHMNIQKIWTSSVSHLMRYPPRVPNTIYRMTLPRIASCEPFVLTMAKFGPKNWSWNVIAHGCYWRNRTTPEDVITCHGVNPTCELPTKAGHKLRTLFSPSTKVWSWFLASLILWIVHSSSKTGRPTNGTPGIGTLLSSQELPKCNGYLWFILACSLIPLGGCTPHEGGCIDSTFKVQAFHFAVILAKLSILHYFQYKLWYCTQIWVKNDQGDFRQTP